MDNLQSAVRDSCLDQNSAAIDDSKATVGDQLLDEESHTPLSEADVVSLWSEEEFDRDPHRALFYDAYRSTVVTPELDDSTENAEAGPGEQKPLSLMDDWELWDYMDEETLKERLKNHPELLEQITRKRKRKAVLDENDDDDLCAVMERHAKVTKFNEHAKVY
ncbi:uncharacterized protein LOC131686228 [Topomyia yanbarensis]|uniref:uncharacterized protein LOC131686228 n=1 Tax=Topomyia yanbarensis TaxID=2498891 RepID=UPI00273C3E12|nr:uncharacterized protein LOC131686228 [Topomyia yanbarensis]